MNKKQTVSRPLGASKLSDILIQNCFRHISDTYNIPQCSNDVHFLKRPLWLIGFQYKSKKYEVYGDFVLQQTMKVHLYPDAYVEKFYAFIPCDLWRKAEKMSIFRIIKLRKK